MLSIIAVLNLIAAPISGLVVGQQSPSMGWLVFSGELIGALVLLGFSKVIEHTNESAQRLRQIETILRSAGEDKKGHPPKDEKERTAGSAGTSV